MKVIVTIVVVALSFQSSAQSDYHVMLNDRLEEIKKSENFDNGIVYGLVSDFPPWEPDMDVYKDDRIVYDYGIYQALADSKGKAPDQYPNVWRLVLGPHPYLFLRDTARMADLVDLLKSDHPFIRAYAVGALASREYSDLFNVVVENMSDTTRLMQYTTDYGFEVCPADLMLWYTLGSFSEEQKNTLRRLVLTRYTHLYALEDVLLFHKPNPDEYLYVREIVTRRISVPFGIVALIAYQNSNDIELIEAGIRNITDHYNLKLIYEALKKFHVKLYDPSIQAIEERFSNNDYLCSYEYRHESSPWRY